MWELTIEPNLESTPTPLLLVRALGGSANATASMLRARPPIFGSHRLYSRFAEKPYLKLVSELRKLTEVSITKAREALAASNNSVSAALVWLQNGLTVSSAQKVVKVAHHRRRGPLRRVGPRTGDGLGDGPRRGARRDRRTQLRDGLCRAQRSLAHIVADVAYTAACFDRWRTQIFDGHYFASWGFCEGENCVCGVVTQDMMAFKGIGNVEYSSEIKNVHE